MALVVLQTLGEDGGAAVPEVVGRKLQMPKLAVLDTPGERQHAIIGEPVLREVEPMEAPVVVEAFADDLAELVRDRAAGQRHVSQAVVHLKKFEHKGLHLLELLVAHLPDAVPQLWHKQCVEVQPQLHYRHIRLYVLEEGGEPFEIDTAVFHPEML